MFLFDFAGPNPNFQMPSTRSETVGPEQLLEQVIIKVTLLSAIVNMWPEVIQIQTGKKKILTVVTFTTLK